MPVGQTSPPVPAIDTEPSGCVASLEFRTIDPRTQKRPSPRSCPAAGDPPPAELREQLADLRALVDALEAGTPQTPSGRLRASTGTFWALDGLKERLPEHQETADGAVMLVGAAVLPTGAPVEWQVTAGSNGLIESDWADLAPAFAALAHPVRLELLRQVLSGTRTTAALAEEEHLGSTGQLHHHLRQLISAGWLHQSGRGTYDVPATRVVPLLALIMGGRR